MHNADMEASVHLDRLISFLQSHFGEVDVLPLPDPSPNPDVMVKEEKEEPSMSEATPAKEEEDMKPDVADRSKADGPALRVRLDSHVAEISLEDFVSTLFTPFVIQRLTQPPRP